MAYDLQEQETLDQFKAWWEKWGNLITVAITVAALALAGYNGLQWYKRQQAQKALGVYNVLEQAVFKQDVQQVEALSNDLMDNYPRTVFAPLGALQAAKAMIENGTVEPAAKPLAWVLDQSSYPEYHTIAAVRLAGVYLSMGEPQKGLDLLAKLKPTDSDKLLIDDRSGDLYFALKDMDKARQSWTAAFEAAQGMNPGLAQVIRIKLSQLPSQP